MCLLSSTHHPFLRNEKTVAETRVPSEHLVGRKESKVRLRSIGTFRVRKHAGEKLFLMLFELDFVG